MKKNGFTLVEVLTAMVVGLAIMAAIFGAMTIAQRTSTNLSQKIVTQQDTRAVLDFMAMEIRMASFNPKNSSTIWNPSSNLLGCAPAALLNKGILIATATTIAVAMDLGPIGPPRVYEIIGDASNEYIVYSYNGADSITRTTNCGPALAILGGTALGSNVRNAIAGVSLFRYFDKGTPANPAGVEIPVASLPARIPDIRRILITIVADTAEVDLNTRIPRRMIYSTNVIVRNHALSP